MSEKPEPPPRLWDALNQIVARLKNEFLLVTLGVLILVVAIGVFAPGVIQSLGAAFFYLLVGLAWLAFIVGLALNAWLELRQPPPPAPAQPHTPPPDSADLRDRYLRGLLQSGNQLQLTGIDPKAKKHPEAAELELSEVFTTLDVTEAAERPDDKAQAREPEMRGQERRPAIAALAEHKHLVLLGEPGSGKTTLVHFLAVCLAGDGLGQPDLNARRLGDEWNLPRLLPVPVVLRDYAARGLPQRMGLWDFVAAELERESELGNLAAFSPQLKRILDRDGGLLLLDGLDEVPDAHRRREQLKAAVERFALDYPRCRILVTSRPYAYQNPDWHLSGFSVRRMTDFSPEQVQEFIEKWYRHIAARDPNLDADTAERYTAQLQRAVQTNPRLAELAPRPLLLTLMASLHRWQHGGALPEKREELYHESVNLLIDLWQRPKQIFDDAGNPVGDEYDVWKELHISPDSLRAALNQVAFKAHRDQPSTTGTHDIPAGDLAGALYEASDDRASISIDRVCRYISDRAGLLVDRGGVYAFPHRTFQEYLAACHLTDDEFPDKLARLLRQNDERWREAVLLAAAKAASGAKSSVWLLAETLCPGDVETAARPQAADWYAALRAAQALIETEQHKKVAARDEGKLERLRGWLAALLQADQPLPPLDRAAAGRALAALPGPVGQVGNLPHAGGDPRPGVGQVANLPYLPDLLWCPVPAGPFTMGEGKDEHVCELIKQPYLIARYPITNAQFQTFVDDPAGYRNEKWWTAAGRKWRGERAGPDKYGGAFDLPNHPVVNVSWYEAAAFCKWLENGLRIANSEWRVWTPQGIKGLEALDQEPFAPLAGAIRHSSQRSPPKGRSGAGFVLRLPTEAEWEKAARGTDARLYPWEGEFDPGKCNMSDTGIGSTSAVGIFPAGASPYGVLDMAGNVWEWCATQWQDSYKNYRDDNDPAGDVPRVLRGGAFGSYERLVRCAYRLGDVPNLWLRGWGFRVGVAPV